MLPADGRAEIGRSEAAATGDMGHLVPKYVVSLAFDINSNFGAYPMDYPPLQGTGTLTRSRTHGYQAK